MDRLVHVSQCLTPSCWLRELNDAFWPLLMTPFAVLAVSGMFLDSVLYGRVSGLWGRVWTKYSFDELPTCRAHSDSVSSHVLLTSAHT